VVNKVEYISVVGLPSVVKFRPFSIFRVL